MAHQGRIARNLIVAVAATLLLAVSALAQDSKTVLHTLAGESDSYALGRLSQGLSLRAVPLIDPRDESKRIMLPVIPGAKLGGPSLIAAPLTTHSRSTGCSCSYAVLPSMSRPLKIWPTISNWLVPHAFINGSLPSNMPNIWFRLACGADAI